jgi:flagellar protein FlbD
MIEVERVNGQKMLINPDLVKFIEMTPDTVVTFTDGEKILLRTKANEIVEKIIEYRQQVTLPPVVK